MQLVPLKPVPNQALSILIGVNEWGFVIKTTNGSTSITITLNGTLIIENTRAVAGGKIIPSIYEEQSAGNFLFVTQNFQLPYYTQFGVTQSLIYLSNEELVVLRTPPTLPITAADFNPIAALPLRFAPKNYSVQYNSLEGNDGIIRLEGSFDKVLVE